MNRRYWSLLSTATLIVAFAGCGSEKAAEPATSAADTTAADTAGKPAPEAAKLLADVGAKTTAEKTASMAITIGLDVVGMPDSPTGPVEVSGQGAIDYETKQGMLHFDVSGMPADAAGAPAGTSIDMVIDGDTAYVQVPESMLSSTGGAHWAKVGPDSASGGLSIDLTQIQQLSDPDYVLQFLNGVSDSDTTLVGTETLHGTDTTHYSVSIDPTKAAAAGGTDGTASSGAALDLGMMTGGLAMPADVWVDEQGRLRQFSLALDMTAFFKAMMEGFAGLDASSAAEPPPGTESGTESGGTTGGTPASTLPTDFKFAMSMKLELWDFGKPVTVVIPDPSDVAEGVSLPGLGGQDVTTTS